MQELVSILMPCFNGRTTLPMALASLLCQTYENWELIFVDDGSTDDSAEIVAAFEEPRFKIFRLERNYGRGAARQRCHEKARGRFIAMLDADDWWYSTKLELQMRFLAENPEISLVGGALVVLDETGQPIGYRCYERIHGRRLHTLTSPPLAFASTLMSARIFETFSYNPNLIVAEDVDLLQRVCLQEPFANLPDPVYVYTEYARHSWRRMRENFVHRIYSLQTFSTQFPWQSRREILKICLKWFVYWCAHLTRQDRRLVVRRSTPLTKELLYNHFLEKQKIHDALAQIIAKKIHP